MNDRPVMKYLPLCCAAAGLLALALRLGMYASCVDDRGLLVPFSLWEIGLWILTLGAAALALWASRNTRAGEIPAAAETVAAIALAVAVSFRFTEGAQCDIAVLGALHRVFSGLAIAALAGILFFRGSRKPVFFGCYGALCLYFCTELLVCYRIWSETTQMQDFVFALIGGVLLMLTAYHLGARAAGMGEQKQLPALSLLGLYFCCAGIPGSPIPLVLTAGAVWLAAVSWQPERETA